MKKNSLYLILTLFLFLALSNACKKEEFTEEDAIKLINQDALVADSISNAVYFTVKVVDASVDFSYKSASEEKSVSGLAGATVTVKSANTVQTATTGADGAATFADLRPGSYSVKIEQTGYTSVDFVAAADDNGYFSVQIPVLSTAATALMTITGTVTYETNLLNTDKEPASGVKVLVAPKIDSFFNAPGITNFAYSGYNTSFTTDAQGLYTAAVPADKAGNLKYDISVPTVEVNQTLMLNTLNGAVANGPGQSAKTVLTRFGTSIATQATDVPSIPSVYCVFGDPNLTISKAGFTVQTDNDLGIDKIHVTNAGANYYDFGGDPVITIPNPNNSGVSASAKLHIQNATGQIEWIEVTGAGSDFLSIPTINLAYQQTVPGAITVATVNGTGGITGLTIVNGGGFLTNKLNVAGGAGTGATFSSTFTGGQYVVNGILNAGSGYAVGNTLTVAVPTTVGSATAILQTPYVSSVQVTSPGSGYAPNSTTIPVIFSYGDATATAYTNAKGEVFRVSVTSGGSKYVTVPTAWIADQKSNKKATASVYVEDGIVNNLVGFDGGFGYTIVPTLVFYNQYEASNPVVAVNASVTIDPATTAVIKPTIISSTVNGLKKNMGKADGAGSVGDLKSVPGGKEYINFYLGTGVRTVGE